MGKIVGFEKVEGHLIDWDGGSWLLLLLFVVVSLDFLGFFAAAVVV